MNFAQNHIFNHDKNKNINHSIEIKIKKPGLTRFIMFIFYVPITFKVTGILIELFQKHHFLCLYYIPCLKPVYICPARQDYFPQTSHCEIPASSIPFTRLATSCPIILYTLKVTLAASGKVNFISVTGLNGFG